jgi:hypothetical protein
MSCCLPNNTKTIQIIEPDDIKLTLTSSGSTDQSLEEFDSTPIPEGQPTLNVVFGVPKVSASYRFEYLYVDALTADQNPGDVEPVVVTQTRNGFVVKLAGLPLRVCVAVACSRH